jgi:hypothetical protein
VSDADIETHIKEVYRAEEAAAIQSKETALNKLHITQTQASTGVLALSRQAVGIILNASREQIQPDRSYLLGDITTGSTHARNIVAITLIAISLELHAHLLFVTSPFRHVEKLISRTSLYTL